MIILRDSREKNPYKTVCGRRTYPCTMQTGDYAIIASGEKKDKYTDEDLKKGVIIERKASVSEIASNIVSPAFWKEIERLSKYEHPILLLEFDEALIASYPKGSKIPKRRWRYIKIKSPYIFSCLDKIRDEYGIEIIFSKNREEAKRFLNNILMEYIKKI